MPDQPAAQPAPAAAPTSAPATPALAPEPSQPAQPSGGDGIRQLREAYEGIKAKYEPWDKLGVNPEQVTQFQGTYHKVYQEVASIGRELGFPDAEILEALHEDPIRTLDYLRAEAARVAGGQRGQAGGQEDLAELVTRHVEQALGQAIGPIQERENVRATNEANALFERTVHGLAVESFKKEGVDVAQIPADEMELLTSATSEILKYDEDALRALKYSGETRSIAAAFQEARTMLDKYYLARSQRERNRVPAPTMPGQPAQPGGKKPTLDEMIDNPGLISQKYA